MNVKDWLSKVAYIEETKIEGLVEDAPDSYYSKYDDSYITFVGMEDTVEFLADREITEELTHGIGYSPKDNKWYGWNYRPIYGFTIGSTCRKGDCHYLGANLKEQEEAAIAFWRNIFYDDIKCEGLIEKDNGSFLIISWTYNDKTPNKNLIGTRKTIEFFIDPLGKGEWVAETMEDAKQMAIDYNKGIL